MMGRTMLSIAAFCIIRLTIQPALASSEPGRGGDFGVFWQKFRGAVLEKNWQMLGQMCNFPVTVKGVLDSDPVYRIGRREFPKVFDRFLREGVFASNEELEFIRNSTKFVDDGRSARRVDEMIFRKTAKGWLLDTFYMQYTSD
jgi:hypothetical protein